MMRYKVCFLRVTFQIYCVFYVKISFCKWELFRVCFSVSLATDMRCFFPFEQNLVPYLECKYSYCSAV